MRVTFPEHLVLTRFRIQEFTKTGLKKTRIQTHSHTKTDRDNQKPGNLHMQRERDMSKKWLRHTDIERARKTERERKTYKHAESDTQRQRERQANNHLHTHAQREREREKERERDTNMQSHTNKRRETHRPAKKTHTNTQSQ